MLIKIDTKKRKLYVLVSNSVTNGLGLVYNVMLHPKLTTVLSDVGFEATVCCILVSHQFMFLLVISTSDASVTHLVGTLFKLCLSVCVCAIRTYRGL